MNLLEIDDIVWELMTVSKAKAHYKVSKHIILPGQMWPAHNTGKHTNKLIKEEIECIHQQEIERVAKRDWERKEREAASKKRTIEEAAAGNDEEDGEDSDEEKVPRKRTLRQPKIARRIAEDSDNDGDGQMCTAVIDGTPNPVYRKEETIDLDPESIAMAERLE